VLAIIGALIYFAGPWIIETAKETFGNLSKKGTEGQQQIQNVGD